MSKWLTDRVAAFNKAAGVRKYIFLFTASGAVGAFDWLIGRWNMADLIGFPSWVAGILVGLFLALFWILDLVVKLENQIKDSRVTLSALRRKGVDLRNDGNLEFDDDARWQEWKENVERWNEDVKEAINKISEADAEWFAVLDIVPRPRKPYLRLGGRPKAPHGDRQSRLYERHDFRVRRLGKMIYRLWGK